MTQYNLINSGTIESTIISGTGNKILTTDELKSLYDNNTTSSGVSLLVSDILYLDVDIGYRVKIDDIKLFIYVDGDRQDALTKVNFYYKNNSNDDFVMCSKAYNDDTFYPTNFPDLFAPRYTRIVIDSLEGFVYEFQILNDDIQVSFGENGNESVLFLDQVIDGYDTFKNQEGFSFGWC